MGRLIDENDVIQAIRKLPVGSAMQKIRTMDAVEHIPTAYDPDKVIEQLESIREKGACAEEDCGHCKYFKTCWDGEMSYRLALDKAIEIIKDGGRNEVD